MRVLRQALILLLVLGLASPSLTFALVVNYGTGSENKSDPGFGLPWGHVGRIGGTTGVYLGAYEDGYWVATATHVGAGNFTLGSTTHSFVSGSAVQIEGSDLTLFRIATDPGLPNLALATGAPSVNSLVTLVGFGRVENAYTKWTINTAPNPDVWTVTSGESFDAHGYTTSVNSDRRWGFGAVGLEGTSYDIGTGSTHAFVLPFVNGTFNVGGGTSSFGQTTIALSMGQVGDSGGAVFAYNNVSTQWELVGIMGAIGLFVGDNNPNGQPSNTAVFGNATLGIDLAAYSATLASTLGNTAIPEPATFALLAGLIGFAALALRRR